MSIGRHHYYRLEDSESEKMPSKMSFFFLSQILVTIGRKAFNGRIDDTAFGNKGERK